MASASRPPRATVASDRLVRLRPRASIGPVARYLGAVALAGVGVDHLWQFAVDSYSVIPTIGTLFALNFASALLVAVGLIASPQRLIRRRGGALPALLAAAGVGIALGSFAGLEMSESSGLFGFMESGYRAAIVLSIALDAATVILLSAFLVASWGHQPAQ